MLDDMHAEVSRRNLMAVHKTQAFHVPSPRGFVGYDSMGSV